MRLFKTTLVLSLAAMLTAGCATTGKAEKEEPEEIGIAQPLTDKPGDPENGRKLAITRSKGNCIACHFLGDDVGAQFPGNAGPNLVEAMKYNDRSVAWIRQKIVNPKVDNPDTVMFTFHDNSGKKRIAKKYEGKPVLTAQEVEDIIAFLLTLRNK